MFMHFSVFGCVRHVLLRCRQCDGGMIANDDQTSKQLDGQSMSVFQGDLSVLVDMLEPMHEPSEGFAPEEKCHGHSHEIEHSLSTNTWYLKSKEM